MWWKQRRNNLDIYIKLLWRDRENGTKHKGGFGLTATKMYITGGVKAEARFPVSSKSVGGLKSTFRIKTLEFLSSKTLQTAREGGEVLEEHVCGGVSAAVQPESCSSALRNTGHHLQRWQLICVPQECFGSC